MHECPECGQACDCIGDDTWNVLESAHCTHDCDYDYDDKIDGFEQGWED